MIDFIAIAREILNYLTVFADALIVLLVICLLFLKLSKGGSLGQAVVKLTGLFSAKVMLWVFIVSLTATLGSLFFSEIAHFEPCKLCWFQRIFMYPLPILFLMALVRKETVIRIYALVLAIVGALIAAWHYFLQVGQMYNIDVEKLTNCSSVGYSPSCASYFFLKFGYITIPMMSLSAFVLIILILLIKLKSEKD